MDHRAFLTVDACLVHARRRQVINRLLSQSPFVVARHRPSILSSRVSAIGLRIPRASRISVCTRIEILFVRGVSRSTEDRHRENGSMEGDE